MTAEHSIPTAKSTNTQQPNVRHPFRPEVCLVFCAHLMLFQRHPGVEPIELTDQGSGLRGEVALLGLQLLLSQIGTFWLLSLKNGSYFPTLVFPSRYFSSQPGVVAFPGFLLGQVIGC